ncbi:hypothetical protein FCM35_KLT03952 [Carex littledalei]|uniref:HMA domain-containing protein n=1 Tax=Carex littledalei TaxID=544730 RepID=A0A833VPS4_9POAL|nr:hypothetical protein FCM35_KLT03952 [Carex littledalei]
MESYQVDSETNKITVTGNITTEEVIKVLQKIGKTASSTRESAASQSTSFDQSMVKYSNLLYNPPLKLSLLASYHLQFLVPPPFHA